MSESLPNEMRLIAEREYEPDTGGAGAPAVAGLSHPMPCGQGRWSTQLPSSAEQFVDLLVTASQAVTRGPVDAVAAQMRARGIQPEDIADIYIPAAARRMGDMWCDDHMGFAAVTVGCARLHALLRDLGPDWRADRVGAANGPAVLLLVASHISHTLGATVLTGQLRRLGLSVRLLVGARPQDVGAVMRRARYDAVLISASLGESLESLRKLVSAVKVATMTPPPVVLGGAFTMAAGHDPVRARAITGADHVTNDMIDALDKCGLAHVDAAGPRQMRKG